MPKTYLVINCDPDDHRFDEIKSECKCDREVIKNTSRNKGWHESTFISKQDLSEKFGDVVDTITGGWDGEIYVVLPNDLSVKERAMIETVVYAGMSEKKQVQIVLPGNNLLADIAMEVRDTNYDDFLELLSK